MSAPTATAVLRAKEPEYAAALLADPCSYCDESAVVLDHIVAGTRGGDDAWPNLTAACWSCNASKGPKSLLGFMVLRRGFEPPVSGKRLIEEVLFYAELRELLALRDSAVRRAWRRLGEQHA